MKPHAKNPEAGFAVLMIYSMAAIIAIMLFMQIPRVAFEAQREKEQLLIDRGEQYSRAIKLYVRKFNKFPPDFDALDNTQNLRFLRRKYKDPMTGKDDWRIIHAGPGGTFTDSLIKKATPNQQQSAPQNFITEMQQTGGNPVDPNQAINIATRQRPSDQPGAPGDPNGPTGPPQQFDANGNVILNAQAPSQAGTPVLTGQIPGQPGLPGQSPFPGQQGVLGQPPFPGQQQFNANGTPVAPGQPFPGTVADPSQQNGQQFGQNPAQPGAPPNGAAGLINQLLTTPRPGGLNGVGGLQQGAQQGALGGPATTGTPGTPIPTAAGQTVIGGGIAGVASKSELEGIKIYNDQKTYNKWEFVYDITKDPARTGATAIPAQNGQTPNGPAQPQTPGGAAPGGASPFGTTTTSGQSPPPPPAPPSQ